VLGGTDELVVHELVQVPVVHELAGLVDRAEVAVPAGDQEVGRVRTPHHPGVGEIVGADHPDPLGHLRERCLEPSGVEAQVVGAGEDVRLGRVVDPGLDLAGVVPSPRTRDGHPLGGGLVDGVDHALVAG
jgi:hypothetical protein